MRNPCPAGQGLCTVNMNGTDFLVCSVECYKGSNSTLTLLIPLICVGSGVLVFALFLWCLKGGMWARPSGYNDFQGGILYRIFCCYRKPAPAVAPTVFPHEVAVRELSPEALQDFQYGNLGDLLKRELMILRIQKRRDLTEYVRYAELSKQPEIAEFCRNLNPTNIPRDIISSAKHQQPPLTQLREADSPV